MSLLKSEHIGLVILFFLQSLSLYFLVFRPVFQNTVKALQLSVGWHFFAGLFLFVVVPELFEWWGNSSSELGSFMLPFRVFRLLSTGLGFAQSVLDYCCIRYIYNKVPGGGTSLKLLAINYLATVVMRYLPCENLWMFNTEIY